MTMRQFVNFAGNPILRHFQGRVNYLDMLKGYSTTAEEWFRIELLSVIRGIPSISIIGTNQQTQNGADRPDFTLRLSGNDLLIELKVLPADRNYPYGWSRFQSSANNKKDFENVMAGVRHGIIYIYWPELSDWRSCRTNLESEYAVECVRQDSIACADGDVLVSYWAAARGDARPGEWRQRRPSSDSR